MLSLKKMQGRKKIAKKKMEKRCMNDYTDCGVREKGPGS